MDNLEEIKTKLAAMHEQMEKVKEEYVASLKIHLSPMIQEIFKQLPEEIESLGWRQYTPYFNDGDVCTFRVIADDLYVNGEYELEELHLECTKEYHDFIEKHKDLPKDQYYWRQPGWDEIRKNLNKITDPMTDFIYSIPEDILQDVFGDHVRVTCYRDGAYSVTFHDHD